MKKLILLPFAAIILLAGCQHEVVYVPTPPVHHYHAVEPQGEPEFRAVERKD